MTLRKSIMFSDTAVQLGTTYWVWVSDAGGNLTDVRMNADVGDFTYSVPTGYSQWSQGSTVNFDSSNKYGSEGVVSESGARFSKSSSNFYNSVWSGTSRSINEGSFYVELEFLSADMAYGITKLSSAQNPFTSAFGPNSVTFYSWDSRYKLFSTSLTSGGTTLSTNDVVGMRIDLVNTKLHMYKNNSSFLTNLTIQS